MRGGWGALRLVIIVVAVVVLGYMLYSNIRGDSQPLEPIAAADVVGFHSGSSRELLGLSMAPLSGPKADLTPFLELYAESRSRGFDQETAPDWSVMMRLRDDTTVYVHFAPDYPPDCALVIVFPPAKPADARSVYEVESPGLEAEARRLATSATPGPGRMSPAPGALFPVFPLPGTPSTSAP